MKKLASRVLHKLHLAIERRFPEKRIFLRSDTETRFVRLTSTSQLVAWTGSIAFVAWSIFATAFLLMDSIGSGSIREQAKREQQLYEMRLNDLSQERDSRIAEAANAEARFNTALSQISKMQLALLDSEDRREEMEKGIEVIQSTLRRTMKERDEARAKAETLMASLSETQSNALNEARTSGDIESTVDFLTAALSDTAAERDEMAEMAKDAETLAADLELERELLLEKNNRIFSKLEDAVSLSLEPLDQMFESVGMDTGEVLDTVRSGYSGQGGPITPITFSTKGVAPDEESARANAILEQLDRMNVYRIAVDKIPFSMPLKNSFRFTSGFGPRWGRLHTGADFASAYGTPIYATADGTVTYAGWKSGYGRVVVIEHAFGLETRYAHQSKIRVTKGQKVSRGDRIGDMGNSGNSTGTHLHYEVRVAGDPVNPMTYIKAAKDVF